MREPDALQTETPAVRQATRAARQQPVRRQRVRRSMLPPLRHLLAVAAGGMVGAPLRVAFAFAFPALPGGFPWATFVENVLGAFLLGLLLVLLVERWRPARQLDLFVCTGILGSFTTFSNISVEWVNLVHSEAPWLALVYPLASIIAGLAAALLGMRLARGWPSAGRGRGAA